jgi:predicted MFS family arabinose efflux permease
MIVVLAHRAFRRLVVGLAASQIGDWLYNVALLAYVYDRTHSAAWLGVTTAARVLPIVVLGPLGGVLADRYDRRRLMISADLVRAGLMLILLACAATGSPIVFAPVLAALATAAGSPYPACAAASVARLVPADELPAANAVRSVVGPICIVAGPALGALVLALSDAQVAFGLNALTFLVSAAAVGSIPAGAAFRPAGRTAIPHVWTELVEGAQALLDCRRALRLIGADILASFVYGVLTVALLFVSTRVGLSTGGYGVLLAATGVGGAAGTVLAARLASRARPMRILAGALVAIALPLPLLAVTPWLAGVLIWSAVGGAGAMVVEVLTDTTLQRELDDAVLARAYGFAFPAAIGGICLGGAVAAPLIAALGLTVTLTVVAAVVAGYGLWLVAPVRPAATAAPAPAAAASLTAA